jgi:hypothetical protein
MAYKMQFRGEVKLINPATGEPDPGDAVVVGFGHYGDDSQPLTSKGAKVLGLNAAIATALSFNRKYQGALDTNVRATVFGKPVGAPEAGATDIPNAYLAEKQYAQIDTPSIALMFYIRRANTKPAGGASVPSDLDGDPEIPGIGGDH